MIDGGAKVEHPGAFVQRRSRSIRRGCSTLAACALASYSGLTPPVVGRQCTVTTPIASYAMESPGRIIKVGERDVEIVRAIKRQLNEALGTADDSELHLDPNNGTFGPKMKRAVLLFQARNVDSAGLPLKQDGEVGSVTWGALFGLDTVATHTEATSPLLANALRIAGEQVASKVREIPRNSNRGPEVDEYLRCAGCPPGNSWCCAFVYWCIDKAAKQLGRTNPMVQTAGCLDHWQRAAAQG